MAQNSPFVLRIDFNEPKDQISTSIFIIDILAEARLDKACVVSRSWITDGHKVLGALLGFSTEENMKVLYQKVSSNKGKKSGASIKEISIVSNKTFVHVDEDASDLVGNNSVSIDSELNTISSYSKNSVSSDASLADLEKRLEDLKSKSSSPIDQNELDDTMDADKHEEVPKEDELKPENNIVEFQFNKELNDFDKDPVSIFLESPVDSGGGDMVPERFDFCKENNVLTVEFESAETKAEVLKRSSLRFKDYVLYVNDPIGKKDFASDNSVMILENVAQSEEENVVTMYAQNMANEKLAPFNKVVETKLSKMFNDTFILKFESDFDPTVVDKRIKRKPKIHDREVKRINAFKSNMAILRDPDYRELKTKIDSIESFLKGLKHPDDSEKAVEFKTMRLFEPYLVIRFTWETDLKVLLNSEPEIDGRKYIVEYFYNLDVLRDSINNFKKRVNAPPSTSTEALPLIPQPMPSIEINFKDYFEGKPASTTYRFELDEILNVTIGNDESSNTDERDDVKVFVNIPSTPPHYSRFLMIEFKEITTKFGIKDFKLSDKALEISGMACNLNKALNELRKTLKALIFRDLDTFDNEFNLFFIKKKKTISDQLKSRGIKTLIMPNTRKPVLRIWSENSEAEIEKCIDFIKQSTKMERLNISPSKISGFKTFMERNKLTGEFVICEIPGANEEYKIVGMEPFYTEVLKSIQSQYY